MDRKSLIAVILIVGGGMLLSRYSGDFLNPEDTSAELNLSPQILPVGTDVSRSPAVGNSFAGVVKLIEPSLVNISTVHLIEVQSPFYRFYHGDPLEDFFDDFFGRRPRRESPEPETHRRRQEGTGSGFIVGTEGYVITNHHVIQNAEELKVTTYDGKTYDAELVGQDPRTDLAVIRIKSRRRFNALKLGDSDETLIGDWVIAAGSPFGLNQTFTAGIISAVRQDVQVENARYSNMLQTDAAINRGNSGGPLVNMSGEVVGINTAIFAPTGVFSGIGFAIPVNEAKNILNELIEKGSVARGWLGVEISDVDDAIKRQFGLDSDSGVLVNRVVEDSAAEKSGLLRADVIIDMDGHIIKNARELQQRVSASKPGQKIRLGIVRDGEKTYLDVVLGEIPEETPAISRREEKEEGEKEEDRAEWLGISVSNITGAVSERYSIVARPGVAVINIDPSDEGYEIGLRVGDVITEINRVKISEISDFKKAAENISLEEGIVLDVIRGGRPLFLSYQKPR